MSDPFDPGSIFNAGERLGEPAGDPAREAVAALRGYAYQLYASALAWLALGDGELLHLEVAEDYSITAANALTGVQVKDTDASGKLTLRSSGAIAAIDGFVDLVARNPSKKVSFRYLTTASIGLERASSDRVEGRSALLYWRRAAGSADIAPLRSVLEGLPLSGAARTFIDTRTDAELRDDLIRRIHWDVGQAQLADLVADLNAGLVEFASRALRLSADVAEAMSGKVLARILDVAVKRSDRLLRRADLILLGERIGLVAVPRDDLLALLASLAGTKGQGTRPQILAPGLIEQSSLPIAPRSTLLLSVADCLAKGEAVFISGSTGMGKTDLACRAAALRADDWRICDFHELSKETIVDRLNLAVGELASSPTTAIVLDDLAHCDDPAVRSATERLVRVMQRRNGVVLITCAVVPTGLTRTRISGSGDTGVEVPYFTEDEVQRLLADAGGNPRWARTVHLAASGGHPQLVQAAILHLKSENWAKTALLALAGGRSDDIAAERRAARERMVAAMPPGARAILFRTSLIYGRFGRPLAVSLGDIDPSVPMAGAELDRLIGPWIERTVGQELRVSPLVAQAGAEALGKAEQECVHRAIALSLLGSRAISVTESDAITFHALRGGDEGHVMALAHSLMTASIGVLESLARYSPLLVSLNLGEPIFPSNGFVSALARLGQLLVVQAGGNAAMLSRLWSTLREETADLSVPPGIDEMVLSKMLVHGSLVKAIPDWLDLLVRFDELSHTSPRVAEAIAAIHQDGRIEGEPIGFLFVVQIMGIPTVAEFRRTVENLDRLSSGQRSRLLSMLAQRPGDFSVWVNGGWVKQAKADGFDGAAAAEDYLAAAAIAERWGDTALSLRCHVAASIMHDEYCADPQQAITVLGNAEARLGANAAISRARAKIHWRMHDHEAALRHFDLTWGEGREDAVESGFIAREAAISAAELGRWQDSVIWFQRARNAVIDLPGSEMRAMAIGLGADEAQARFMSEDSAGAVAGYARALEELRTFDPEGSLRAAYCHRVIRHAVLWLFQKAGGVHFEEFSVLPPGACSNPDPLEAIRDRPLGDLDLAWYLLADAEFDLDLPPNIFPNIRSHLAGEPITALEIGRPKRLAGRAIERSLAAEAAALLIPLVSAACYLAEHQERMMAGDMICPERGEIPQLSLGKDAAPKAVYVGDELMLAFGVAAAVRSRRDAVDVLRAACDENLSAVRGMARRMAGGEAIATTFNECVAESIGQVATGMPVDPTAAFLASARFALFVSRSQFRAILEPMLADWVGRVWREIAAEQQFRLKTPAMTAGPIAAAAATSDGSLASVAATILAAAPAVSVSLGDEVLATLRSLAKPGDVSQ